MVDIEGGGTIPPTTRQTPPWRDSTVYESAPTGTSGKAIAVAAFCVAVLAFSMAFAALIVLLAR